MTAGKTTAVAKNSKPPATPGTKKSSDQCSRAAADEAVSLLLSLHEREQAGKHVDVEFVAMAKGVELRHDDLPQPPPSPIVQLILDNPMILRGIQGAAAAAVLYGLVLLVSPLWTSYHVAGKVFVNGGEAEGVELVAYGVPGDREVARGLSTAGGGFRIGGLGRGVFKITGTRLQGSPQLPEAYAALQTTPWRIKVDKSVETLTLYATDAPKKAEPPPKFDD